MICQDMNLSRRHGDAVSAIVGRALWRDGSPEEDAAGNTDHLIPRTGVACRIRRHQWLARHCGEFTIRSSRDSGAATEIDKLTMADVMFYAFEDAAGAGLARWAVLDLAALSRRIAGGLAAREVAADGGSFLAFRFADAADAVIDASWLRAEALLRRLRSAGHVVWSVGGRLRADPPLGGADAAEAWPLTWELCRQAAGVRG